MTTYFVTGATGFIGRHLVERLLEREGDIHVLVREGSREKLERWASNDRVKPVIGDLNEANLGVDPSTLPHVDHFVEGHSLASLEALAQVVAGKDAKVKAR